MDRWLTAQEAAEYAQLHQKTIIRFARLGKIKAGFDGKCWKFKTEKIDAFLMGGK